MPSYTPNYNLKKPAGGEAVNIADINNNMDTIDSTMKENADRFSILGSSASPIDNLADIPLNSCGNVILDESLSPSGIKRSASYWKFGSDANRYVVFIVDQYGKRAYYQVDLDGTLQGWNAIPTGIVNALNDTSATAALSANQGKVLNEKVTSITEIKSLGTFATLSALGSALDTELGDMSTYTMESIRFSMSSAADPFESNVQYCGIMLKTSAGYGHFTVYSTKNGYGISGSRYGSSWSYSQMGLTADSVQRPPITLLSGSNLNNLYNESDTGFYYLSSGVTNSPVDYAQLIVSGGGSSKVTTQLILRGDAIYSRRRSGSPMAWTDWQCSNIATSRQVSSSGAVTFTVPSGCHATVLFGTNNMTVFMATNNTMYTSAVPSNYSISNSGTTVTLTRTDGGSAYVCTVMVVPG